MPRGWPSRDGDEMTAQNGYHYVRVKGIWRLKHHIIAEEKLRRRINTSKERVIFIDRNRNNLDPNNIQVEPKRMESLPAKRARLEAKRDEIQAQLDELGA